MKVVDYDGLIAQVLTGHCVAIVPEGYSGEDIECISDWFDDEIQCWCPRSEVEGDDSLVLPEDNGDVLYIFVHDDKLIVTHNDRMIDEFLDGTL